jgi:hypothetical protein
MNIHILASRNVIVEKTGEKSVQEEYFDEWQTPTKVSYEIEKSDNPIQAYKDWVMSISRDEEVTVYAEDDILNEGEPIGTKTVNYGEYHIEQLNEWIEVYKNAGYEISVEVW